MLVGCGSLVSEPEPGEPLYLTVDAAFTLEQRAEVDRATNTWRTWTEGQLDVRTTSGDGDATVYLGEPRYSRLERTIHVPPDAVYTFSLSTIGFMAGMPRHAGDGVLGEWVTEEFNAADRESCRAAGYCR